MPRVIGWLIALPPALALGGVLVVGAAERAGFTPLAYPPPSNSAEAAADRNAASMLQLLLRERPGTVHRLRPGALSEGIVVATTAEAALWSRQLEMIQVLDRESAVPTDPDERARLACLALDLGAEDIAAYLVGSVPTCEPGAALLRMRARSE
jgi:hypothetical protein